MNMRGMTRLMFSIVFMCSIGGITGFSYLQDKYPGRGLQVIENIFKEGVPFEQAIEALKEGNRIRRKSERRGYVKIILMEGKRQKEKFGTYWISDNEASSNYCTFSIEDVLATDWIIDE